MSDSNLEYESAKAFESSARDYHLKVSRLIDSIKNVPVFREESTRLIECRMLISGFLVKGNRDLTEELRRNVNDLPEHERDGKPNQLSNEALDAAKRTYESGKALAPFLTKDRRPKMDQLLDQLRKIYRIKDNE